MGQYKKIIFIFIENGTSDNSSRNISVIGRRHTHDALLDSMRETLPSEIPAQSLPLPKLRSVNSSPCESFFSIQIDCGLSTVSEGEDNIANTNRIGSNSPNLRPATSFGERK